MLVCEVKFREAGKRYYFNPLDFAVKHNDFVVVETVRGVEIGQIVGEVKDADTTNMEEIKPIIRMATDVDILLAEENKLLEEGVIYKTKEFVKTLDLNMKVLGSDYTLNKDKLIIYFESEQRVDFRDLVRLLSEEYRTRIELRQIGSRDGAKLIGSIGPCGLVTCCETFLGTFDNVTIKMAKNQNLSLNPQKISGNCGKLLCCIKYEDETYEELRKTLPDVNDFVMTKEGKGKVISIQIIKQRVRVLFPEGNIISFAASEVKRVAQK